MRHKTVRWNDPQGEPRALSIGAGQGNIHELVRMLLGECATNIRIDDDPPKAPFRLEVTDEMVSRAASALGCVPRLSASDEEDAAKRKDWARAALTAAFA
jgi:hypothetical protein